MTADQKDGVDGQRLGSPFAFFSRERFIKGLGHGVMSAVAAGLGFAPAPILGLHEGYWGAITAVTIVQADFKKIPSLAVDQLVGAAIGGGMAVLVLMVWGQGPLGYAAAVILSILACWVFHVETACRVAGITATIILLIPHANSPEEMWLSRIGEVCWGVLVAAAVLWVVAHFEKAEGNEK